MIFYSYVSLPEGAMYRTWHIQNDSFDSRWASLDPGVRCKPRAPEFLPCWLSPKRRALGSSAITSGSNMSVELIKVTGKVHILSGNVILFLIMMNILSFLVHNLFYILSNLVHFHCSPQFNQYLV